MRFFSQFCCVVEDVKDEKVLYIIYKTIVDGKISEDREEYSVPAFEGWRKNVSLNHCHWVGYHHYYHDILISFECSHLGRSTRSQGRIMELSYVV